MLSLRHRLAAAGVVAATAIAFPVAALASGPGAASGKPAAPHAPAAIAGKSAERGSRLTKQPDTKEPSAAGALAVQLGVSQSAAQRALTQLQALGRGSGSDPASPGFAAIARELRVTPARLDAALRAAKQSMAGAQSAPGGQGKAAKQPA